MCEKQTLIALTGPTAVGKTALSLALAKELNGEIISADSMQVYRGMDIGTAKIRTEEMQGIPHHLIDILEPEENFDAMQFQQRAANAIADIQARGKVPILVGGTGFYLQTVLYDVPFSEESRDEAVHAALAARRAREGIAALYAELTRVDPEAAAQIHPNNEKRVLRALEYYLSSGEKISLHNAAARERRSPYRLFYFVLNMDRASLYRRIDARVEAMFEAGLVEEVRTLPCRASVTTSSFLTSTERQSYRSARNRLKRIRDILQSANSPGFAGREMRGGLCGKTMPPRKRYSKTCCAAFVTEGKIPNEREL